MKMIFKKTSMWRLEETIQPIQVNQVVFAQPLAQMETQDIITISLFQMKLDVEPGPTLTKMERPNLEHFNPSVNWIKCWT